MAKKRDKNERGRRTRSTTKCLNPEQWLICCEGRSELLYLSALIHELAQGRQHGIHLGNPKSCKPINGMCGECGRQHISLYSKAQQCAQYGLYKKVWIVFDLDAIGESQKRQFQNFSKAVELCQTDSSISAAWSVPNFEFFLSLHSGSTTEAWSNTSYSKKIRDLGSAAIASENLCLQKCEKPCQKPNAKICEKVLEKPYYNGFYALGGLERANVARELSEKSYQQNIEHITCGNFRNVTSCSSMHQLIQELIEYFDAL